MRYPSGNWNDPLYPNGKNPRVVTYPLSPNFMAAWSPARKRQIRPYMAIAVVREIPHRRCLLPFCTVYGLMT